MGFSPNLVTLRERAAKRTATPATPLPAATQSGSKVAKVATVATHAQESALPAGTSAPELPATERVDQYAHAREAQAAMHRLGHTGAEAEEQLQAVLHTAPAATVAADLQAIGDERGLQPATDAEAEQYAERLALRGLKPADAAELAQRLVARDRNSSALRSCAECAQFKRIGAVRGAPSWFCQHPAPLVKWGCHGPAVLFRCEGFRAEGSNGCGK